MHPPLTDHRHHGKTHGLPDDNAHAVQGVCHRVGGGLHRAEQGDHAHHDQPPQLEEAVFTGIGNADSQDTSYHFAVSIANGAPFQAKLLLGIGRKEVMLPGNRMQS